MKLRSTPRIKNFYRLNSKKGLMITGLEGLSPAAHANLREGDIIIEFDGGQITSSVDLTKKTYRWRINT